MSDSSPAPDNARRSGVIASREERARGFREQSFHEAWNYVFEPREPGRAEVRLEAEPAHLQIDGVVHGGVLATLGDTAGVYSIYPDLEGERTITSIEFKLNFLAAARASAGTLVARARALKVGRSVATSDVEIFQGETLVAKGIYTYLVLDPAKR